MSLIWWVSRLVNELLKVSWQQTPPVAGCLETEGSADRVCQGAPEGQLRTDTVSGRMSLIWWVSRPCLSRSSWASADNRHHQWQDVLNLRGQQTLFVEELLEVSWQQTPSAAYGLESPAWVLPPLLSSHLSKWHNSQMWWWFLFERGTVLAQTWSPRSISCTRDDPELVSEESSVVFDAKSLAWKNETTADAGCRERWQLKHRQLFIACNSSAKIRTSWRLLGGKVHVLGSRRCLSGWLGVKEPSYYRSL